jgi:hypothetical protein
VRILFDSEKIEKTKKPPHFKVRGLLYKKKEKECS